MKVLHRIFHILLYSILVFPQLSVAQKQSLKGTVADSVTGKPVQDATVLLLKGNKAIANAFSDPKGIFTFTNIPSGSYQLYISLLGYRPSHAPIIINQVSSNLGRVLIQKNVITLQSIEIKQLIPPVVIKKDTLEFNAGSYKTRPNAVVGGELLKQVPGISIDQNGKITAHGETVKRILVDGKPFFGNNTALTTQNLPAELIDKVQLIDGKSDQAQFSGFDDGNNEKIINITLKKNRRRGSTAATSVGIGTDDRFAANANVNSFNEKDRLSAIGNGNNLNNRNFNPGNTFAGMLPGNGLARNWSGALNYNLDNKSKLKLDASYEAGDSKSQNNNNSFRQTFLQDTSWYYQLQNNSTTHATNHNLNMRLNYKINSAQSIMISPSVTYTNTDNIQTNHYASLNNNKDTSISGMSLNTSHQSTPDVNIHGLYRIRFKQPGQTLSADLTVGSTQTNGNNTYQTKDHYLVQDSISGYNRLTTNNISNGQTVLRLSYTTPIAKDKRLQLSYLFNNQTSNISNYTYDIDSLSGKYENPNDSLSNRSKNKFQRQIVGIQILTQKKGYDYTLGLNTQYQKIDNTNSHASSFHRQYINLFPTARMNIALSKGKNIRFNYDGNTIVPTVEQLQPLPNLANSLLVQEGNPDLKPSFSHRLNLGYNAMNKTTFRGLFINLNTEFIANKIVNTNRYDTSGHQFTKPINANGAFNCNGSVTNSLPIKSIHATLNLSSGLSYNRDITFNNSIKSFTQNFSLNQSVYFNYKYETLLDINTILQCTYSGTRYGSLSTNNTNYLNYNLFLHYNFNLPADFTIGNDIRYIMNRGRATGFNTNIALLNGYIAKSILKQKQALVKLYGYDLLNQNTSVTRNTGDNYIEDVRQTVLPPYLMISFTWFFKNFPAGISQSD